MAKKKAERERYSQKRIDKLMSIIPGEEGSVGKIEKLSETWKKDVSGVKSTWYRLHKDKKNSPKKVASTTTPVIKTSKHTVDKHYANKVAPMIFEQIEVRPKGWINPKELEALHGGLELAMKDSFPHGKSIIIASRLADKAREYLEEKYPEHVFRFTKHPNEKITDHKVLSRRN